MENLQPKLRFPEFRDVLKVDVIENICKVDTGNKDTQNKVEDGEYPFFVRSNNVEKINSYSYDGEAVLTSGDGVGVGKNYHYINGKFDYHQRVYCMKDFKNINARYFYYQFSNKFYNRVMRMTAKNSVDSVRREMITKMDFFIPTLQEQIKIADFLGSVDKQLDILSQKKEKLNLYKKGVMQQLFSQQIRFKDDNGSDFPDWQEKTLGEVARINSGSSPTNILSKEGKIPYFKVEQLNNCKKYQINTEYFIDSSIKIITKGSIIFPKRGASILLNKVRILKVDGFMDTNMMSLTFNKDYNEFMYYLLVYKNLSKIADTTSIPQINNKHIEPYKITIPLIEEQTKIADFLSAIDTQIETVENQITKTETYKKGLLQQMFV